MLLRGPSGSGKSALALALMEAGWRLAADDRVLVWLSGGRAWGRAPSRLAGLIEARGQGVAVAPRLAWCALGLVADLSRSPDPDADRVPEPAFAEVAGAPVPRIAWMAGAPAASLRLRLAMAGGFDSAAMGRI